MTYLLSLDEYSDRQIQDEFLRRVACIREYQCTYCEKKNCACRMKNQDGKARGLLGGTSTRLMFFGVDAAKARAAKDA